MRTILFILFLVLVQSEIFCQERLINSDAEKALPFSIASVTLDQSWIKQREDLNTEYLKSLDPERLLHNFRVNAGLRCDAPDHNSILPFTRNVVGSMDYNSVTFTNSQYPIITSYGHELALSVVFESALQHMADRPEGYYGLPDAPRSFLKEVPVAWDDTILLDGYPGCDVVIARRKGDNWYIGGLNSEKELKTQTVNFNFLEDGIRYRLTLIADGTHDKEFSTQYTIVDRSGSVDVKMLRRGGFAASLKPLN
jgi:hypothetical protein